MVDVNEHCGGGNEYTILVNIVDGTNTTARESATFEDRTFVFDQLSPGDYSCLVIVTHASVVRYFDNCDILPPTTTSKYHRYRGTMGPFKKMEQVLLYTDFGKGADCASCYYISYMYCPHTCNIFLCLCMSRVSLSKSLPCPFVQHTRLREKRAVCACSMEIRFYSVLR